MTTPRLSALLAGRALGRAAGGPGGWAVRGAIPTGGIESPTSQRAAAAFASAAAGAVMAATVRGTPPHPSRVARTAVAFSSAAATVLPPAAHHPLPPPPRRSTSALLAAAACVALGGLGSLTLAPTARHTARAQEDERVVATPSLTDAAPWVKELAAGDGVVQILSADDLEKQAHAFLRADHVFSALLRHDMVRDLVALYDPSARRMAYVIQLGENVCGYPRVAHGGLTAAIVDEAMGHLFYALRVHGDLPFIGPAFTAHLEVDYHRKISAGRLLLVTAEVESVVGRKLRMRATVTDGPPGGPDTRLYASASALFVAPKPARLVKEVVRYVVALVVPGARFD